MSRVWVAIINSSLVGMTQADSPVAAWVIPTNEELMIATHTRDILL